MGVSFALSIEVTASPGFNVVHFLQRSSFNSTENGIEPFEIRCVGGKFPMLG